MFDSPITTMVRNILVRPEDWAIHGKYFENRKLRLRIDLESSPFYMETVNPPALITDFTSVNYKFSFADRCRIWFAFKRWTLKTRRNKVHVPRETISNRKEAS